MQKQSTRKFKDGTAVFTKGGDIYLIINGIIYVENLVGTKIQWESTNITFDAIYDENYNYVYTRSHAYENKKIMKIVRSLQQEDKVIYQREEN